MVHPVSQSMGVTPPTPRDFRLRTYINKQLKPRLLSYNPSNYVEVNIKTVQCQ